MSRRSAVKNPDLWHEIVLMWCERLGMTNDAAAMRMWVKQSRSGSEISTHVDIANSMLTKTPAPGATESARRVLTYFYCVKRLDLPSTEAVDDFVRQAWLRYAKDPRRDLERAFLLAFPKRGNPGGIRGARKLTPGEREEIAELVVSMVRGKSMRSGEKQAVQAAIELFKLPPGAASERLVRRAVAEYRHLFPE